MVKIRLLRIGRNKMPYYRIVAVDSKAKSNGAYIELLGQYDPLNNKIALKEDKIKKWLSLGAQPTDTVRSFLSKNGLWSSFMSEKNKAHDNKPKKEKTSQPKPKKSAPKTTTKPKKTTSKTEE